MNALGAPRRRRSTVLVHLALALFALLVMFPFLWILAASLKHQIDLLLGRWWFTPTLSNYVDVLFGKTSDYRRNFLNSTIIGIASTALVLFVATFAAFSIVRLRWPNWVVQSLLGWALLFHMIPPITLAGAWYTMFRTVGLDNTWTGLVFAHATLNLPMALWMMTVFIRDVPRELIEAAQLDHASTPAILRWVVVPIVKPGLAATAILSFIFSWNEFAVALVLTQRQTATVPLGIGKYAQENTIAFTEMAAASMLSIVPAFVLLLVAQRLIVRGLTSGALK